MVSEWGDAMRWYCLNDLFFLSSQVVTDARTKNSQTGKPLYFDQFYLDWCRQIEYQIEKGGGSDHSARGSGKSTLRTKNANIQRILKYPQSTGCIFSFQRKHSRKHFRAVKEEFENNELLKQLFDDLLEQDPIAAGKSGRIVWSMDDGLRLRVSKRKDMTLEYNAFFDGTPTGGRFDWMDFDDIEDHKAIQTEHMLEKLHTTYDATIILATAVAIPRPVILFTNTFYSDLGLAARVSRQYSDVDPKLCRKTPGEDLTKPGEGPLGGTPVYPFDKERLFFFFDKMRDKREYAIQICCDFRAGEGRIFDSSWLQRYPDTPEKWGAGKNIYICIDPSKGVNDPMAIWVWALGMDKKIAWVDCSMRRLDPALPEFMDEVFLMYAKWSRLGRRVVQVRVENFGQATYAENINKYLKDRGCFVPVIGCADTRRTGKFDSGKRDREFDRWATPASQGDVLIPRPLREGGCGLMRRVDDGRTIDLVEYFLDFEWTKFPKPITDNLLDAGSLLWEPEDRMQGPLQFPSGEYRKKAHRTAGSGHFSTAMSMG